MSSCKLTNTYQPLAFLITSNVAHNTGTTSETGHRQYALQRHGIWWCPCLENEPPTSNGIFSYSRPLTMYTRIMYPVFSQGGCTNSQFWLIFQYFYPKTTWKWIILTPGGERVYCTPHYSSQCLWLSKPLLKTTWVTLLKCTHTYTLAKNDFDMWLVHGYQLQLLCWQTMSKSMPQHDHFIMIKH